MEWFSVVTFSQTNDRETKQTSGRAEGGEERGREREKEKEREGERLRNKVKKEREREGPVWLFLLETSERS